ncbi:MAG: DUF3185 family protein [Planctomycetota bacterium]
MNTKTLLGAALLIGGIVALYFGREAQRSVGSQLTQFFEGTPSDKAVVLLVGGGIAVVAGLGTLGLGLKKSK